jgi:hypothetical protein
MKIKPYHAELREDFKSLLLQIQAGETEEVIKQRMKKLPWRQDKLDILFLLYELKNQDQSIASEDVKAFLILYKEVTGERFDEIPSETFPRTHPVSIFIKENEAMLILVQRILDGMKEAETELQQSTIARMKDELALLGQFYSHYNRKEKILFPIIERYGYYSLSRMMWGEDDRIRNLYKGTKSMMERLPKLDFYPVKNIYENFAEKFKEMVVDEEMFLLPIITNLFTEAEWQSVEEESEAFGYALIGPEIKPQKKKSFKETNVVHESTEKQHLPFGGGYLTLNEANLILNHLPLEITFVDKHDIFKYFNDRIKASDMMFIRTPSSIGRNVANCHPPRSLKKVMRLIRDLKTRKKTSESMWFTKDDKYLHITYKGVFDDEGEYVGILEYVQDIQPFFDLPRNVKKELSEDHGKE